MSWISITLGWGILFQNNPIYSYKHDWNHLERFFGTLLILGAMGGSMYRYLSRKKSDDNREVDKISGKYYDKTKGNQLFSVKDAQRIVEFRYSLINGKSSSVKVDHQNVFLLEDIMNYCACFLINRGSDLKSYYRYHWNENDIIIRGDDRDWDLKFMKTIDDKVMKYNDELRKIINNTNKILFSYTDHHLRYEGPIDQTNLELARIQLTWITNHYSLWIGTKNDKSLSNKIVNILKEFKDDLDKNLKDTIESTVQLQDRQMIDTLNMELTNDSTVNNDIDTY